MNRAQQTDALRALGVTGAEPELRFLDEAAVDGVIRWAQDQNRKGRPADSSWIVAKLRQGGLTGYGTNTKPAQEWWTTQRGRDSWTDSQVPDLDPVYVGAAISSLLQAKREPTVELVRQYAEVCERQQREHGEACEPKRAELRKAA